MIILGHTASLNKLNKAQECRTERPCKHGPLPNGQAQIKTREETFKSHHQTKKTHENTILYKVSATQKVYH